jgi:glycosyltransferase involved in cell wall biosynthesis
VFDGARPEAGDGAARLERLSARSDWFEQAYGELVTRVATLETLQGIDALSRLLDHAGSQTLRTRPLISIVLPTYDRPDRLRRAIESVIAQRYEHWELIVVDDGGEHEAGEVVDAVADQRVHCSRIEHRGVSAARNVALSRASGDLVTYLDDDNLMDAGWLHAVAWAFERHPEVDVLYGAIVADDEANVDPRSSVHLPRMYLQPFNRQALRDNNLTDMGAIAHRSGLAEAHFDDGLREMGDWDLLIRLTAEREPLVLPAVACYYLTDAPRRLSRGPTHAADRATVRQRAADAPRA